MLSELKRWWACLRVGHVWRRLECQEYGTGGSPKVWWQCQRCLRLKQTDDDWDGSLP